MWLDMVINVKKILLHAYWPEKRLRYTVSNIIRHLPVMVINFRGLMKFGIWALTLYKVDSSNVLSIMQKKIVLSFA